MNELRKRRRPFSPVKDPPTTKKKDERIDSGALDCLNTVLEAIKQLMDKIDTFGS